MFIDEDRASPPITGDPAPPVIAAQDLLLACAGEAARQAAAIARLDATIGAVLLQLRAAPQASVGAKGLVAAFGSALQEADLLRQESAGLARALELLCAAGMQPKPVDIAALRACAPTRALQARLLAPPAGANTARHDPP